MFNLGLFSRKRNVQADGKGRFQPRTISQEPPSVEDATAARDPVCGMRVDKRRAAGSVRVGDRVYLFCSLACKDRFREDPERFLPGEEEGGAK